MMAIRYSLFLARMAIENSCKMLKGFVQVVLNILLNNLLLFSSSTISPKHSAQQQFPKTSFQMPPCTGVFRCHYICLIESIGIYAFRLYFLKFFQELKCFFNFPKRTASVENKHDFSIPILVFKF